VFRVYVVFVSMFMVVSTGTIDCLERFVSEMSYCVSSGTLNPTYSLTNVLISLIFCDAFVRTNCCTIAVMIVRLCVWFGRAL